MPHIFDHLFEPADAPLTGPSVSADRAAPADPSDPRRPRLFFPAPEPAADPGQPSPSEEAPPVGDAAAPARPSRRRRLWDLPSHAHCPVVGGGLPLATLRRLAGKALGGTVQGSDYELHCGVVAECGQRHRVTEALQRELDRRYLVPLRAAAHCKDTATLRAWWLQQSQGAGLPGALWATLTHPRCDNALEQAVLAEVHMRQHQAGFADRCDLARLDRLHDDHEQLKREVQALRQRLQTQQASFSAAREAQQAECVRLRGRVLARDTQLAQLQEQLQALQQAAPDLAPRQALAQQLHAQGERLLAVQRQWQQAQSQLQRLQAEAAARDAPADPGPDTDPLDDEHATLQADALGERAVLCVGGRQAAVPVYRRLVEASGGRFLHHDGGEEDKVQRLDQALAAADLVICQTGCVSHNAYWRVKDHCKRHGKPCVFVERPSAAHIKRAFVQLVKV